MRPDGHTLGLLFEAFKMKSSLVKREAPLSAADFIDEVDKVAALGLTDRTAHMLVADGYRVNLIQQGQNGKFRQ